MPKPGRRGYFWRIEIIITPEVGSLGTAMSLQSNLA
jgi:hypothetical protein